jgi:hypothetical protein
VNQGIVFPGGGHLSLRPPCAGDRQLLGAFLQGSGSGHAALGGAAAVFVARYIDPDWTDRGALIAVDERLGGRRRILALAAYARLYDSRTAEITIAVTDPPPLPGLITTLVGDLVERAADADLEAFTILVGHQETRARTELARVGFQPEPGATRFGEHLRLAVEPRRAARPPLTAVPPCRPPAAF